MEPSLLAEWQGKRWHICRAAYERLDVVVAHCLCRCCLLDSFLLILVKCLTDARGAFFSGGHEKQLPALPCMLISRHLQATHHSVMHPRRAVLDVICLFSPLTSPRSTVVALPANQEQTSNSLTRPPPSTTRINSSSCAFLRLALHPVSQITPARLLLL